MISPRLEMRAEVLLTLFGQSLDHLMLLVVRTDGCSLECPTEVCSYMLPGVSRTSLSGVAPMVVASCAITCCWCEMFSCKMRSHCWTFNRADTVCIKVQSDLRVR